MSKRIAGIGGSFYETYRIIVLFISILMAGLGVLILMDKIVMNRTIALMILLYGVYNLIEAFYIFKNRK